MRVFYSSELEPTHPLALACQHLSIAITTQPLIRFEAINAAPKLPYEVIFFSSPRAFEFGRQFITPASAVACYAHGTAKYINSPISWQGNTPGNPSQTAQEFHAWVGQRRVFFPVSDRSLGSITKVFSADQIEVLSVYHTLLNPIKIPTCAVYIFTSPSNVESFILINSIPLGAHVIAWGDSTAAALLEAGIEVELIQSGSDSLDWERILTAWVKP
jgi:uroporphyrinogen-III synthase